jgi:thioredoxin reductase
MHGFLSRDGTNPTEFLLAAREEVKRYGVEIRDSTVMDAGGCDGAFEVTLLGGERMRARKLLLATGVVDRVPQIEGFDTLYGKTIHHCPYCDGWEYADAPIAVYGSGHTGAGLAIGMRTWTEDIVLCSNGPAKLSGRDRARLAKYGIKIHERCITRVAGSAGKLERIEFDDGSSISPRAIFFSTGNVQRSELPASLGCTINEKGAVKTKRGGQQSSVTGVWVCGDASEDTQYVVVAAAEGAKAAMAINKAFQQEDQA